MTIQTEENSEISFDQFGLSGEIMKAIKELGYEMPSPIQQKTIPLLLEGKDIIGQAQTGTGKTNIMLRYFKNTFDEEYKPTNGSHVANRNFNYRKTKLDVEVLEIGGHSLNVLIPQTFHGM